MVDHQSAQDGSQAPLLPSEDTAPSYGTQEPNDSHSETRGTFAARLTARDGYAVLISIVIGSGVFTSPGSIDANVPSPGAALLMWLVGGLLTWTGAITMAELGTAIPSEGGIQPYLMRIYGEVFGFLAAWTWIVAIMPATLAILSIAFVDTIASTAGSTGSSTLLSHKLFSLLVLVLVTATNSISTKTSTRLGNFFVVIKLLSIILLIVAGLTVLFTYAADHDKDLGGGDWHSRGWFNPRKTALPNGQKFDWTSIGAWELLGHYSTALYGALWAYSGWDKANYIAAELSNASKQLPLAINTAMPTIIVSYVASNAAYYVLLSWKTISTTDSVAVTAMIHLLGQAAAIVAAVLICLVIAGSLLGNSFITGRMIVAAANKNWLPQDLNAVGRIGRNRSRTSTRDAPINALLLSAVLSAFYILLGDFRALITFNGLGEYSFFFLAVIGDVFLRWKDPQLHRPFKPLIFVPMLFTIICGFIVVRGAIFAPIQAGVLVGLWVIGILYYNIKKRLRRRRTT